jgi:hypothetical protein
MCYAAARFLFALCVEYLVLFRFKICRLCSAYGKWRISYKLWFGGIMLDTILRKEASPMMHIELSNNGVQVQALHGWL